MRDIDDYLAPNGTVSQGGRFHIDEKRSDSEEITKNGVKLYRYVFICGLNHGLARQEKPLPAGKSILNSHDKT